jgi:hypothetical protein
MQPPGPRRTARPDFGGSRLAGELDLEAVRDEGRGRRGHELLAGGRDALQPVALDRRDEELKGTPLRDEARESRRDGAVPTEDAAAQRAPRESNGDEIGQTCKLHGRGLRRRDDERGIRNAALARLARGASGGLGHRRGAGIEPEDEGRRLAGCGGEHRPAVTSADIDRHPLVAGDEIRELTDVHLDEAASDDESKHGPEDTRRCIEDPAGSAETGSNAS